MCVGIYVCLHTRPTTHFHVGTRSFSQTTCSFSKATIIFVIFACQWLGALRRIPTYSAHTYSTQANLHYYTHASGESPRTTHMRIPHVCQVQVYIGERGSYLYLIVFIVRVCVYTSLSKSKYTYNVPNCTNESPRTMHWRIPHRRFSTYSAQTSSAHTV